MVCSYVRHINLFIILTVNKVGVCSTQTFKMLTTEKTIYPVRASVGKKLGL